MSTPQTNVDEMPQNGQNEKAEGLGRLFGWRPWRRETSMPEFERAYHRFLGSVTDVLSDFMTLEVNSVLVRNISADHPLTDVEFLRQIAVDLSEWFTEHPTHRSVQRPLDPGSLSHLEQLSKSIVFPLSIRERAWIDALRTDSTECLANQPANGAQPTDLSAEATDGARPTAAEVSQPSEYRRFLRYLQKFLLLCDSDKWDEEGMLRGREQQQLRKLWELVGTSFIYAQTVVGLDGDVVSRLNEQLLRSTPGLSRDMTEALIRFHNQNTQASAQGRNNFMAMIVDTFRSILRR